MIFDKINLSRCSPAISFGDPSFRTYIRAIGRLPATANFISKKRSRSPKVVADFTYGDENLGKGWVA
jgi:hypothetical protein